MVDIERYKKLRDEWDARVCMMLSLLLQIFLFLSASLRRRKTRLAAVSRPFIWLAYLAADSFSIYVIGKLSRGLNDPNRKYSQIIVLWAPFLLLHLGGPDTITAYALEDNEFWLRHLLTWLVQLLVTMYAIIAGSIHNKTLSGSFPDNNLIVPVSLVLLVGIIRNIERTLALYSASIGGFKKSIPSTPNLGMNYAKLMHEFYVNKEAGLPTWISIPNEFPPSTSAEGNETGSEYHTAEEVAVAHLFFTTFKPLIVDLLISFNKREQSRDYLLNPKRTANDAFKLMDIELGLAYDILFTKAGVVHSCRGCTTRVICFFCIVTSLAGFLFFQTKQIPKADVLVTYFLLGGAIVLDIIGSFKIIFSDWFFTNQPTIRSIFCAFAKKRRLNISQYNFINTCLYYHKRLNRIEKIKQDRLTRKALEWAPTKTILDFVHTSLHTSEVDFDDQLKNFIFEDLKKKLNEASKSTEASEFERLKQICSSRGSCALRQSRFEATFRWTVEVEFAESILLWHVATDLCNHADQSVYTRESVVATHRTVSKVISEYMLYLLVQQPSMISSMEGIRHIKYQDAWDQATSVIKAMNFEDKLSVRGELLWGCSEMLQRTELVLFDACFLVKILNKIDTAERWGLISSVWAELLIYAASHCRGNFHAQGLVRGGELLTYVWLLMAHLGVGLQFHVVSSHANAKMIVVK